MFLAHKAFQSNAEANVKLTRTATEKLNAAFAWEPNIMTVPALKKAANTQCSKGCPLIDANRVYLTKSQSLPSGPRPAFLE